MSKAVYKFFYKKIAVFGDNWGLPISTSIIPQELITCIIGASIRPEYFDCLENEAKKLDIEFIVQPKYQTNSYEKFIQKLRDLQIDMVFCNSYSMIIREDVIRLVCGNAFNIHGALLPKNRGCNPTQWSIIKGYLQTGVTIHYIDSGLDTGDIIAQKVVPIAFEDTWVSVQEKIKETTQILLVEQIPLILTNSITRTRQNEALSTYNPRLNPSSPKINFDIMSDLEIYNLIRAQISPLKGAYIIKDNHELRFPDFISFENIAHIRNLYA